MKKVFMFLALALATMSVSAQDVTIGVRAGLNFANMSEEGVSPDSRLGLHAGVVFDIPVAENFFVQPGLFLSQKGAKMTEKVDGVKVEANLTPLYLEVPVLASYRIPLSEKVKLHLNAGPYLAYGISGKTKAEAAAGGYKESAEVDLFGDEGSAKRFDAGVQIGAGLGFLNNYYAGIAYEWGVTNISQTTSGKTKNRNFMISLGYNF